MIDAGLILEGGGTRGVFTAGVLQYFMEQGLDLSYVIGVSAGACNAADYVSGQPLRSRQCMIDCLDKNSYIGLKILVKKKTVFDMDALFDVFPNKLYPFDYNTYFHSGKRCYFAATNCLTGRAEYLSEHRDRKRLMTICRASSSLPLFSKMVNVNGTPMLDGGLSDSVPIRKALRDGYRKNVVILTRNQGYRKKTNRRYNQVIRTVYRNYPNLVRTIIRRPYQYNRTMELIERLERDGRIFVIRPQTPAIHSTERNKETLKAFYSHGYEYAREIYPQLLEYLQVKKER